MMTKKLAHDQLPQWRAMAQQKPDNPEVLSNLASCLFTVGEADEALSMYSTALTKIDVLASSDPGVEVCSDSGINMNFGMVLKDLGHFAESSVMVRKAFLADPDYFYLKLGWMESLLRNGNWRDAWPLYDEARPMTKFGARNMFQVPPDVPLWLGERLIAPDNKLLVIGEGGTGDRITYSRWLPELDKLGADWRYYPDAAPPISGLMPLFQRVPWLQGKIPEPGYVYNYWTTVFSLPAALEAIPTQIPEYPTWFVPDPELKKRYEVKRTDWLPTYGLIWGANELFEGGMKFRSLLESQAMRIVLSTSDKAHWVNCWMGDSHGNNSRLGEPVLNPKFENWEETAALLANMDGIVSTDNGAGWLAQALGLPCSVLLSGNSDWKFLRGTEKSYWSKRARLFRNEGQGFESAVTKCIAAIRNGEGVGRAV